jgi:hypothetical protein
LGANRRCKVFFIQLTARSHVFELIFTNLAHAEIGAVRVGKIEATHTGSGRHGQALGYSHADVFAQQQIKQVFF